MRTLAQLLQDHDPGYLRIVAELWGLEFPSVSTADDLGAAMLDAAAELALPERALPALHGLQRAGGRMPFEELVRRYGPLREMGAGRRDRLRPWRDPVSALEMLWYRGLVGRAFADSAEGPREYGFIPNDLLANLPQIDDPGQQPLGFPADDPAEFEAASSWIVDDATTMLADLRRRPRVSTEERWVAIEGCLALRNAFPLLLTLLEGVPADPERIRRFLRAERGEALRELQRSWAEARTWNDLAQLKTVQVPENEWPNDPYAGRKAALDLLEGVPVGRWWSLESVVRAAMEQRAEFLRSPGGFEAWYIQRVSDGSFLHGFAHWDAIEGEYLRYLLRGPLHWLGATDLSADRSAFRLTPQSSELVGSEISSELPKHTGKALVRADGRVRISRYSDRSLRYQIARLTRWEGLDRGAYRYRISARALRSAEAHGLTAANAAKVLTEAAGRKLPAGITRALERWSANGLEAAIQEQLILQVEDPQVLERLSQHRTTRRYIQEVLGPNRAVVNSADWRAFQAESLKLGLLVSGLGDP